MLVAAYSLARIYTVNKADVQCVRQRLLLCIPINLTVSQRDRHQHFPCALHRLHCISAILLRHLGHRALQCPPPLPPIRLGDGLKKLADILQRCLSHQTNAVVRNHARSILFHDDEAAGSLGGIPKGLICFETVVVMRSHLNSIKLHMLQSISTC